MRMWSSLKCWAELGIQLSYEYANLGRLLAPTRYRIHSNNSSLSCHARDAIIPWIHFSPRPRGMDLYLQNYSVLRYIYRLSGSL